MRQLSNNLYPHIVSEVILFKNLFKNYLTLHSQAGLLCLAHKILLDISHMQM